MFKNTYFVYFRTLSLNLIGAIINSMTKYLPADSVVEKRNDIINYRNPFQTFGRLLIT